MSQQQWAAEAPNLSKVSRSGLASEKRLLPVARLRKDPSALCQLERARSARSAASDWPILDQNSSAGSKILQAFAAGGAVSKYSSD